MAGFFDLFKKPKSKNVSEEVIDQSTSVISSVAQSAGAFGKAENLINLVGCSNVKIKGSSQKAAVKVNFSALQSAMKNTDVAAKLSAQTTQAMQAKAQALQITSQPVVENMKKLAADLSTKIVSNVSTKCESAVNASNAINCQGSISIELEDINQDASASLVAQCIQKDDQISKIASDLDNLVKQEGKTTVEDNISGPLMAGSFVFILFLLIVAYLLFAP